MGVNYTFFIRKGVNETKKVKNPCPKAWWSEEGELAVRIDGGHAPRLIASHMLRHHGEHPQSSPGPKLRPGRPPATICPPAQAPVLFSTSLTQLLARRVLPATQNFKNPNPPKALPTSMLPTSAHISLNKHPGSLVVMSVVS